MKLISSNVVSGDISGHALLIAVFARIYQPEDPMALLLLFGCYTPWRLRIQFVFPESLLQRSVILTIELKFRLS